MICTAHLNSERDVKDQLNIESPNRCGRGIYHYSDSGPDVYYYTDFHIHDFDINTDAILCTIDTDHANSQPHAQETVYLIFSYIIKKY